MRGRKQSPEHAAKSRTARLGARSSDEHRRKISEALMGRPLSDEHRRRMTVVNSDPELQRRKAATRKAKRKAPESHRAVHKRLVRDRGAAGNHKCTTCSNPANAWAHNWSTWEDVAQDIRGKRMTFSTNLDAYQPLCHSCHNELDRSHRPWDNPEGPRTGVKLTETDVRWIRTCGLSLDEMAASLGIHRASVCAIRLGRTWKDIA